MRLLLIEDDPEIAGFILKGFTRAGHTVDHVPDGDAGLIEALNNSYDVMIVDRMLPGQDGLAIIQSLREAGGKTPVLILSALHTVDERVRGLNAGGDDYLVKPFALAELSARVEALARRPQAARAENMLEVGELVMQLSSRKVVRDGKEIPLQNREFLLLEYLMRHAGQVVTRTMLLENVWDMHFDPQTNVIDVQMSRLRQKVDKGFDTPMIKTVRGTGYMLSAE